MRDRITPVTAWTGDNVEEAAVRVDGAIGISLRFTSEGDMRLAITGARDGPTTTEVVYGYPELVFNELVVRCHV